MKKLIYPPGCNTEASKLSLALCAAEKSRLEHNVMGTKFRNKEITKAVWDAYLITFDEDDEAIQEGINENSQLAREGTFWVFELKDVLVDK